MAYQFILVDDVQPGVRRVRLNRPEKRNALNNILRGEVLDALEAADRDADVRLTILSGEGSCFSAGYDLSANNAEDQPYHTAGGVGNWPRHVVDGYFRTWDLAKPVIAQVHGYCLAGATELATACDLVYVAENAQIGYPVVRAISPPDMQLFPWLVGMRRAMELMLTGDPMTGAEAAEAGFANRAFPESELEASVLAIAERIAKVPSEVQQFNKRSVHRAMEMMGMRDALRAGTEIQALAAQSESARAYFEKVRADPKGAFDERDRPYGDYRTSGD